MKTYQLQHTRNRSEHTSIGTKSSAHCTIKHCHKMFRKVKNSSLYCPFTGFWSHVRQPRLHGVNLKNLWSQPSCIWNSLALISSNTAINFYFKSTNTKWGKKGTFLVSKVIQFHGTNSYKIQNMALDVIINTVVTLSAWLTLSSTLQRCCKVEASLENNRQNVFSYLWKSSD